MSAAPHLEPVRDRDYIAEMRAVIAAETGEGPYVSAVVAGHIARKLAVTDPDLLDGWLRAMAPFLIRHVINLHDCSTRTRARTGARRQQFAEDANAFERGNRSAMSHWLDIRHVVDDDGTRKRLADMTAADLTRVADEYDSRATENAMHATFLKAVARKVGTKKTVADVFDESTLDRLWRSLSGA
jgi:hypothetical protein